MRPWVTPKEVKLYTDTQKVKDRPDQKLEIDIARAEIYVINYVRHDFSDTEKYPEIPKAVKIAVLLLAEMYATNAQDADSGGISGVKKSESFDDYSYTLADVSANKIDDLDLPSLLDEFVEEVSKGTITAKLRKL